jgi:hypothetical protein
MHIFFLYRQQELFAKAREEQAAAEQQQWLQLQAEAQMSLQQQQGDVPSNSEDGEYS